MINAKLEAQNRIFDNSSFEPGLSPTVAVANYMFVNAANTGAPGIQGWNTTASDGLIELWSNGMLGFLPLAGLGNQWAELNATQVSRLYQNVCLVNGETLSWVYYHRGRQSALTPDVMELNIYDASGSTKIKTLQTASTTNLLWQQYTGSYLVTLPTGSYQFSFEAISTAGGDNSIGNFVDGINIGSAFVEFNAPTYSSPEATGGSLPKLILNGQVNTTSVITLEITGGTATQGTDYTLTTTISIPPGRYSPLSPITIPLTIINDALAESNETIQIRILSATNDILPTDANCDGINQLDATYTIIDDDIALAVALLNFSANETSEGNLIKWKVADEKTVGNYIVEKSENGIDFTVVTKTITNGTGSYILSDKTSLSAKFYRLSILEKDGSYSYSPVVALSNSLEAEVKIFPNPTQGLLHLYYSGDSKDISRVEIFDELRVKNSDQSSSSALNDVTIDLQGFSAGVYYLKVICKNESKIFKILKE